MFHIVLFEPEIPPNTGNIIRLCANTGSQLHLIKPLGFELDNKQMRRAGLDYHEFAKLHLYDNFADFLQQQQPERMWACSTKGTAQHTDIDYQANDYLLFGPETRGLPLTILEQCGWDNVIKLPMVPGNRSLNLANAVAVFVYEAWRQQHFAY